MQVILLKRSHAHARVRLRQGAFVERLKFSSFLLFTTAWSILVYAPVCHWVWGGGWLAQLGVRAPPHTRPHPHSLACHFFSILSQFLFPKLYIIR